ncbi:MAG: hypothetical protein HQL70_07750 [Magnetococcales bacterium]|nr:hypothetical protein [Magnetococcales bacterium]
MKKSINKSFYSSIFTAVIATFVGWYTADGKDDLITWFQSDYDASLVWVVGGLIIGWVIGSLLSEGDEIKHC